VPKRFSSYLLFRIRNHIPITELIREKLKLPWKQSEGEFRFLCPICSEFNTATNRRTNLARCFRCKKNFNPIDIVMVEQRLDFIKAVSLLTTLLPDHVKSCSKEKGSFNEKSSFPGSNNAE
jgi:DNA primase